MLLQLLHAVHGLPGVVVPAERDEIRAVSVAEFYQVVVELGHRHHGLATERAALPASYRSSGRRFRSGWTARPRRQRLRSGCLACQAEPGQRGVNGDGHGTVMAAPSRHGPRISVPACGGKAISG